MNVETVTLGCRLNAAETDIMRRNAVAAGFGDLTIVNTCAVTEEAVRQSGKAIRRAARERPGDRIVVTGCAAQIDPARFAAISNVTAIIGNDRKTDAATWLRLPDGPGADIRAGAMMDARPVPPVASDPGRDRTRALVQVQTGCDHRCTFCVIPFGRGPSRSVPAGEVVAGIRALAEDGVPEIVLTGVDITAYGADLPGRPRLGALVRNILRTVPGLPRLRLSSIDSVEADDDLLDALASEPRLMPHLHLSLQSGDDLILKRMKRRHGRDDAIAFCEKVRRLRPGTAIGADLIAGFPTETEEMFTRSLDLVRECGIAYLHVFPYSARPGTPASRMPRVPPQIVKERAARLRAAGNAALTSHLDGEIGRVRRVLAERGGVGRAENHALVRFPRPVRTGRILTVRIARRDGGALLAA